MSPSSKACLYYSITLIAATSTPKLRKTTLLTFISSHCISTHPTSYMFLLTLRIGFWGEKLTLKSITLAVAVVFVQADVKIRCFQGTFTLSVLVKMSFAYMRIGSRVFSHCYKSTYIIALINKV